MFVFTGCAGADYPNDSLQKNLLLDY